MIRRGDICWIDLGQPAGSDPAHRRPIVVVSDDEFNRSRISTVIGVVCTTNLRLADAPGNVMLHEEESGLPYDSVVNVSQVITVDKAELTEPVGAVGLPSMRHIEGGLRLVLGMTSPLQRWRGADDYQGTDL